MADQNTTVLPQIDMSTSVPLNQAIPAQAVPTSSALPKIDMNTSVPLTTDTTGVASAPGVLSRTATGVEQGIQEFTAPVTPLDHKEALVSFLGGPGALSIYKAGKAVVNSVEKIVKPSTQTPTPNAYQTAVEDFHKTLQHVSNKDYRNAASSAGSTVGDVLSTMPGPGQFLGPQIRDVSEGLRLGADLATPLAKDLTKDTLLGLTTLGGAADTEPAAAPEAEATKVSEAADFNAASKPNIYQQVTQGEKVAQAPAQEAVRTAVKSGGDEVGLSTAQPAGLRTLAEEPINTVNGLKKIVYGQVDQAAGTDLKTLYGKLDAINDKIDLEASGSPEEARLEAQRTSQMQTIEDAKQVARSKGVNVDKLLDQGDALHTKEMALREFQKNYLKNPNIIEGNSAMGTPETANVDSGIKVLQKMQDNTRFGAPRLEQALGKEGANQLLKDMYAAQRLGVKAVDAQNLMSRIIKIIKLTGVVGGSAVGAYELAK